MEMLRGASGRLPPCAVLLAMEADERRYCLFFQARS